MNLDPSDWIAMSSAFIAFSAIGVAIWQGHITRKHNILSVRPHIQIHVDTLNGLTYTLQNHGLGPGKVTKFTIFYDRKKITNPTSDPYEEIFSSLGVNAVENKYKYEFHLPLKGATYTANQNVNLLKITPVTPVCNDSALKTILNNIRFEIAYTCMYKSSDFVHTNHTRQ